MSTPRRTNCLAPCLGASLLAALALLSGSGLLGGGEAIAQETPAYVEERERARERHVMFGERIDVLESESMISRLAQQDLSDDIQRFLLARTIVSLGGPEGTSDWIALEQLAGMRLEARLSLRILELKLFQETVDGGDSPDPAEQDELAHLRRALKAMDAEHEALTESLARMAGDYFYLNRMIRDSEYISEWRHEVDRRIAETRMLQLMPPEG